MIKSKANNYLLKYWKRPYPADDWNQEVSYHYQFISWSKHYIQLHPATLDNALKCFVASD